MEAPTLDGPGPRGRHAPAVPAVLLAAVVTACLLLVTYLYWGLRAAAHDFFRAAARPSRG